MPYTKQQLVLTVRIEVVSSIVPIRGPSETTGFLGCLWKSCTMACSVVGFKLIGDFILGFG